MFLWCCVFIYLFHHPAIFCYPYDYERIIVSINCYIQISYPFLRARACSQSFGNAPHLLTSAKTGQNIEEVMSTLVRKVNRGLKPKKKSKCTLI